MDVNEFVANVEAITGPLPRCGVASDFRSHTCGECGWAYLIPSHKVGFGEDGFICRYRGSDLIAPSSIPACPAYVPRDKGAAK